MDDGRHSQAREDYSNGGCTIDFSPSFQRTKRQRAEETLIEEERKSGYSEPSAPFSLQGLTFPLTVANLWRLPRSQTLLDNQKYLNEQLQHVVALSSVLKPRSSAQNGTRKYLAKGKDAEDDIDKVCTIDLTNVRSLVAVEETQQTEEQEKAECEVRAVMDLVCYLLYLRNRELDHQNRLSEDLSKVEKQLERKSHIAHTLAVDLEMLKQELARKENIFKAREKNSIAEKKSLQSEKKTLEVNCARLQGVETACKAQLRRKDVEYARLKKSLQEVVGRASKEKQGMAIAKTLNGVRERKQALNDNLSKESKLTRQILDTLEQKKVELLLDNEALTKSYNSLQHHLESLTSQYKKAVQLFLAQKNLEGDAEELDKLASAPIDDFTPAPFNMATKDSIIDYISASMGSLEEKLKQLEHVIRNEMPSAEARSDKEIIKRLRDKLDNAHNIIKDQDQLLQASLSPHAQHIQVGARKTDFGATWDRSKHYAAYAVDMRSSPNAAFEEEVKQEKAELALVRKNLEKERQLLQEQALKLDKDRLEFEIAKRDQLFGNLEEAALHSTCEQTLPSLTEIAICLTPKQQCRAQQCDLDGPDSPFDVPISATPDTATLLKKIGINVPTEE